MKKFDIPSLMNFLTNFADFTVELVVGGWVLSSMGSFMLEKIDRDLEYY